MWEYIPGVWLAYIVYTLYIKYKKTHIIKKEECIFAIVSIIIMVGGHFIISNYVLPNSFEITIYLGMLIVMFMATIILN